MFNFTRAIFRHSQNNIGKYVSVRINSISSAPVSVELKPSVTDTQPQVVKTKIVKNSNNIVAAAFASLSNVNAIADELKTPFTDKHIDNAKTIDELLSISADGAGISRRHALKVVSILATWSSTGKVKLNEFESDSRFIKLCKVLTKNGNSKKAFAASNRNEDLNLIMNMAADDEAAKLVASITLAQMVKVMQTLAIKKRRSTMLLRSLSFNITKNPDKLDLKQSADLLYSMCVLNFPDQNLLEKVCTDILQGFSSSVKKSSVIGSIITSLGILKYKDTSGVLDSLCVWMLDNHATCRSQDLFALILTLGVLNHHPRNEESLFKKIVPQLSQAEAQKPNIWLDYVWSMVVLNRANKDHIDSVLSPDFRQNCDSIPSKIKLLHVNAASQDTKLPKDSDIFATAIARTKEKEEMVSSVLDTLKNLVKIETYIRSNVDKHIGFYIDAECIIDPKGLPVAYDNYSSKAGHVKIAIMVQDYHDMCRGRVEPIGTVVLQMRLLEQLGYKVIQIPFYEYRVRDKLIHRVQLIESKLKSALSTKST